MLVDFNSAWFKSYSQAVLESEPDTARARINDALQTINQRLHAPDLSSTEREAIQAARQYLTRIGEEERPKVPELPI